MRTKKIISYILSITIGLVGILFLYSFFTGRHGIFTFVIGLLLIFMVVYNIVTMLKYTK